MMIDSFSSKTRIVSSSRLKTFCQSCRKEEKKIVLATGVFDILHPGHLHFLEKSKSFGDILIVGINDDAFARKKGPDRPYLTASDRAILVAGFRCVDRVHIHYVYDLDSETFRKNRTNRTRPKTRR